MFDKSGFLKHNFVHGSVNNDLNIFYNIHSKHRKIIIIKKKMFNLQNDHYSFSL